MDSNLAYDLTRSLHFDMYINNCGQDVGFPNDYLEESWSELSKRKQNKLIKFVKDNNEEFKELFDKEVPDEESYEEQKQMMNNLIEKLVDEIDFVPY